MNVRLGFSNQRARLFAFVAVIIVLATTGVLVSKAVRASATSPANTVHRTR